jgi:hypothetical protein
MIYLLLLIALQPNDPSYTEPDYGTPNRTPTAERECASPDGNPDGSWCVWTNPANGKKYLVDKS